MTDTKVARRYAQSLMDLAIERKVTEKVNGDMLLIANTISQNRELLSLLKNPIIHTDKKEAVITALFSNKIDGLTNAFLAIITKKGREEYLGDIATSYVNMHKELKGIKTAFVTTAFPMDDELRSEVMGLLKRAKGDKVELIEKIDTSLIGGFILRIGDIQYDASISKKLKALQSEFDENLYIREF